MNAGEILSWYTSGVRACYQILKTLICKWIGFACGGGFSKFVVLKSLKAICKLKTGQLK
ncbi:MAG: hypothetical protein RLZ47_1176 [Bacteroidota bacterium]|jgi:hypothetical protein